MSTELTFADSREEEIKVLQSSLYPGSKKESVLMVLEYCKAAGLDPMQKPVHIVPMSVKNPETGNYDWRDVVMPGIGLYRIQADRSKTLAGISEPEFGEMVNGEFKDKYGNTVNLRYPEWCKITVHKLVGNHIVAFTAKEYWEENYATDSGKSSAPNSMWRKRPRGQIAKCAEAQALRKAFPEVGSQPTAEEIEGKTIDMGDAERVKDSSGSNRTTYPDEDFRANFPTWQGYIEAGKATVDQVINKVQTKGEFTDDQLAQLRALEQAEPVGEDAS